MTTVALAISPPHEDVLHRLEDVCEQRGAPDLAVRLAELRRFIQGDLAEVEASLGAVDALETPLHKTAHHLLSLEGKRLRPMCVTVAARLGAGWSPAVRDLAVAVELVHSATLLHDDVVDVGDVRRGAKAARVIYGNAASIFGGDWLLVEALTRIRKTGLPDVLDRMLDVLKQMLMAEAFQLKARGSVRGSAADYFRIVEGKTAALFQWAMFAGGRAGGVPLEVCRALEAYGRHLGVAFQMVDDVLDLSGDSLVVGKSLFADLREGKMTYPLLLAVERDPDLGVRIEQASAGGGLTADEALERRAAASLRATGAIDDCLAVARRLSSQAIECLAPLPSGRARDALESIAVATLERRK